MFVRVAVASLCLGLLGGSAVSADDDNPVLAYVKPRLKDAEKPFTLVVFVTVKEDAGDKFEAAFAKAAKATRKEKGCLRYEANRDQEKPQRYVVYERWQTLADLKAHLESDHVKELLSVLPDLADGKPEFKVLFPAKE